MAKNKNYEVHEFYCIQCGKSGIPLPRKRGYRHEKFHRKKMYCPNCKEEINHIECKTMEDVLEFKENFEAGVYTDEAEESLAFMRDSRVG